MSASHLPSSQSNLPPSKSDPVDVKGKETRKRKREVENAQKEILDIAEELKLSDESVDQHTLRLLLERITQKLESSPPSSNSIPFTSASAHIPALFGTLGDLPMNSSMPLPAMYQEAADALLHDQTFLNVLDHVVMNSEESCRSAIDPVLFCAVKLAQKIIEKTPVLDEQLATGHGIPYPPLSGQPSATWLTVWQERDLPEQDLGPVVMHGRLDYMMASSPRSRCQEALKRPRKRFLRNADVSPGDPADSLRKAAASISEAKKYSTMDLAESRNQAACQGAAACLYTGRESFVNTLTNGLEWSFYEVVKRQPGQSPKPFTCKNTGTLDIFDNTAFILYLVTMSILYPGEFSQRIMSAPSTDIMGGGSTM
ncbi:hypothetical protein FB45DRAFT_930593 [Roridomyces roridus]|uniref:Uncharacterized protein n=1 Tax=Roridomyces roridus TaxID=1738132 RepID=A0AAD7BFI6_9AGAR|nr:hypothetical protein FB45DRAFT_930593 [Roridomyces roridus]